MIPGLIRALRPRRISRWIFAIALLAATSARAEDARIAPVAQDAADSIVSAISSGPLQDLLREVLARNPDLRAQEATAEAAAQRGEQTGGMPDPVFGSTTYLQRPQTRVGPQELMLSLTQKIPWIGTLGLKRQAADHAAVAERAKLQADRLRLVTRVRRLYYELGFLQDKEVVVREDRATLAHYEEVARARYTSGVGLEQAVIKIQAELTRDDARLLEIATKRAELMAEIDALRDVQGPDSLAVSPVPHYGEFSPDPLVLRGQAEANRPEVAAADARIRQSEALVGVARKAYGPNLNLGLTYSFVGGRTDPAGQASPPPDNGEDAFGIVAGFNLPLWRGKLAAGVDEARLRQVGAEERRRAVLTRIDRSLSDLVERLPLTWKRVRLYEDELSVQADQSLRSAESGYAAGTVSALELLDAERVLLDVRIATARARTDYAVAVAHLEGAVGLPLNLPDSNQEQH
jgi:cobalt-zinc-cadmium efflux system outer membrane protein